MQGQIIKVAGPLIVAQNMGQVKLFDMVRVGEKGLIGEIIELREDKASIQVYENTAGLKVGDVVESTDMPLCIELAPGLIGSVFDGIGRSLSSIYTAVGDRITQTSNITGLDYQKLWKFEAQKNIGDMVSAGDVLGIVPESGLVEHKILVPMGVQGKLISINSGEYNIVEPIATIKTEKGMQDVCMLQKWPVRRPRPYQSKLNATTPLVTGQRILDTLFPVAKGGIATVPGPFGSGKTVVQHQLAKYSDAEIVVYIGCGERGNEMTEVLNEFPTLKDPKTGKFLMERTILVANTSDMPVAAREASIYTGITIAEYYRDMGYSVVVMADSTSRWAEALREMSGRLEEMPGEEGYPAYLGNRLASFYERAGLVQTVGSEGRTGAVTVVGAVSPQGGDLSEPVVQATLRIAKVFWGLSASLANKKHFPAIDWQISYSNYWDSLNEWYKNNVSFEFLKHKNFLSKTLQQADELNEVIQLVGFDVLGDQDKMTLEIARIIKEDYLQQNAFDENDAYTSIKKQSAMLNVIYKFATLTNLAIQKGKKYDQIMQMKCLEDLGQIKYITENELENFANVNKAMQDEFDKI